MMSKTIAFAGCTLALVGQAAAADLPSRVKAPVFVPPPVFTWTGVYVGINAGYAFDNKSRVSTFSGVGTATGVPATRPAFAVLSKDGFAGGGQIGYNYEFMQGGSGLGGAFGGLGGVVVGVEADAQYTDLSRTVDVPVAGRNTFLHAREAYIGTVRGRLGFAFDRFLVYGTGGFAYGKSNEAASFFTGNSLRYFGSGTKMQVGYAYGGGVEYALPTTSFLNVLNSGAVTVKAEYLRYDLGTAGLLVPNFNAGAGAYVQRIRVDGNLVRAGLNFKFGSPPAPVVARY